MSDPRRVAVVGVTGYAGFELAKLLLRHPKIEKPVFYLREGSTQARCLTEIFPQLRGWGEAPCRPLSVDAIAASGAGTVFLSTPHEVSLEMVPELVAAGLRVIDLSGAFRFRNAETFAQWYKLPSPPADLLAQSVYGLPELYADQIRDAQLVANPGCYPTSAILGLKPLVESGWIARERGIVCDCKSGASGAGKEPKRELQFVEVAENFRAYGLFTHRHTPEVTDHLGLSQNDVMFSTHLLPVARGILSTLYAWLAEPHQISEVEALYRQFYAGQPMVRIWPAGKLPELQYVTNTNFCDIGFALDATGCRLAVVSCLDNLGKGAAGQAVQSMNAMWRFETQTGLI
jgi:N-acetyl-gamma-glutamyl-phosphate reductase